MDKYEVVCIAGEGTYGIVFKCKRRDSGEIVAIKQFKENDREDEEAAKTIQREIKILRMLKHEHIINTQEVFREKGLLHIVCEYVDKCLLDVMDENPSGLSVETTRKLMYQLTRAIEYCHRQKVIHRDIKPDNLLLTSVDWTLKICDFGSACVTAGQTALTDYAATRWYRAPELLVRFNNYGPGVDMWAMGCVMAELVAGQPLFAGETDLDQLFIIINALGPLTAEQTRRCFELTGFVKFPEVGERQTLAKRLGRQATDQQMRFLSRIFVVDPTERLTANVALSLPWLTDWSASLPPSAASVNHPSSRAQTQSVPESAGFGVHPKPRISKVVGVSGVSAARGQPAVGAAGNASVAARNISKPDTPFQQVPRSHSLDDPPEILEEISEGSILEELAESSGDSSPVRTVSAAVGPLEAPAPPAALGAHNKYSIGIAGCATQGLQSPEGKSSAQGHSALQTQELRQSNIGSAQSIQESIMTLTLPTDHQDHIDDSIVEELSTEQVIHDQEDDESPVRPLMTRQCSPIVSSRKSSKHTAQQHHHIRPVSSGSSARMSSLTPMS